MQLQQVFGIKPDIKDNLQYVDESEVVFGAGHNIVVYNLEKRTQRFLGGSAAVGGGSSNADSNNEAGPASSPTAAGSTGYGSSASSLSTITAMAVTTAGNHKLVAVAEKGERAEINIYTLSSGKRRLKQSLVCNEMTSKEFVSLAFSPDGKHLLAQGGAPDWILINFAWEKSKPVQMAQVSNQTGAPVYQCSYCPSDPTCVCVTGNGILRFLRVEPSEFKSILFTIGKREPQNYLCHTWVDDRILVGTDTGDILVFENAEFRGVLASSPANGKSIDCIAAFSKGFVCGCEEGVICIFERDEKEIYRATKSFQIDGHPVHVRSLAVSPSEDNVLCTLQNQQAFVLSLSNSDILKPEEMSFDPLHVPLHSAAITGVDVCARKPLVATCSVDRSVRVWNYLEHTMEAVKVFQDEPLSVAIHPSGLHVLVGFQDAVRYINLLMDEMRVFREINVKQCREARFSHGGHLFALANSTVVQVYGSYSCELVTSLRAHKARIQALCWSHDDSAIVSTDVDGQVALGLF